MQLQLTQGSWSGQRRNVVATLLLISSLLFNVGVAADSTKIVVKGSTTVSPIARLLGAEFESKHPGVEIDVSGIGSIEGVRELIKGNADIALSSTFISNSEIQLAQEHNVYPVPFRIAYDCILPIVNRRSSLTNITLDELKAIYLGKIDNWSQLGGADLTIQTVSRDDSSGTHKIWRQIIMDGDPIVTDQPLKTSNHEVVEYVANNPGAIGYIGLSYLNARVKPLKVDGVMGSTRTLLNGTYPISRPLFLFTNGWPNGRALDFINFALNPKQGQKLIERAGYIPLN